MLFHVFISQALSFAYALPNEPLEYRLQMEFDGFLPVLGGVEQKARVDLTLTVQSNSHSGETAKLAISLAELKAFLYDTDKEQWMALPFTTENVKQYFPDSSVEYTPLGRIVANSAPDANLPLRLPGFHVRHVPDMTCLLLQFPEKPLLAGAKWKFNRRFGDSNVDYDAEYLGADDKGNKFKLRLSQTYETFEDENGNPVLAREQAAWLVSTAASGEGYVWFSGTRGWISSASIKAKAVSTATRLSAGQAKTRNLNTTFELEAKPRK